MATVYRVQDADGRGPWRPGFSDQWVEPRPDHDNLLPWFAELPWLDPVPGHVAACGCSSLADLQRWFTESEYRTLLVMGFRAVAIPFAKVVGHTETQCLFLSRRPLSRAGRVVALYP